MKKAVVLALAAIMVLGVAGAAFAGSATYTDSTTPLASVNNSAAPGVVSATVNPKISLTVVAPDAGQTVAFGAVDPGATYAGKKVTLTVVSNKKFNLTSTQDVTSFGSLTLVRDFTDKTGQAKTAGASFDDNYSIVVPADADPQAYSASVTYSAVQVN